MISRRGEAIAWFSAILVLGAWTTLVLTDNRVSWAVIVLGIVLLLSAFSISLSNWMDRRTELKISPKGIHFRNGLRDIDLGWDAIQSVRVSPAPWGKKIQVQGKSGHFNFHTLGEVKLGGEVKGKTGFSAGEDILRTIVLRAGLQIREQLGEEYYYARE